MRLEMFKRMMEIQETKIDLLWEEVDKLTQIFRDNVDTLTPEIKRDFLKATKPFLLKYSELIGEEDVYGKIKKEEG